MATPNAIELLKRQLAYKDEEEARIKAEYDSKLSAIRAEKADYQEAINMLLGKVGAELKLPFTESEEKKESLRKAIVRILKRVGRFLHVKEILQELRFESPNNSDLTAEDISRALTALKYRGNPYQLITVSKGLKANTFHGFVYWLEDSLPFTPLPQYMYDESLLVHSTKEYKQPVHE